MLNEEEYIGERDILWSDSKIIEYVSKTFPDALLINFYCPKYTLIYLKAFDIDKNAEKIWWPSTFC